MSEGSVTLTEKQLHNLVKETVNETLLTLGMNTNDPIEVQKDFQYIREFRVGATAVKRRGVMTLVSLLVTAIAGLIWVSVTGGGNN